MTYRRKEIIGPHTLYLGDCREILPTLGKVDAVVTDPPYGIGADKGKQRTNGSGFYSVQLRNQYADDWDHERPDAETFAALLNAAPIHVIWGGNYFTDVLPVGRKWLFWDKCQTMPTYSDGEMAWTSLPGVSTKRLVYSNNGLMAREKDRVHPTQKPVEVMRWCIGHLPPDVVTILDPFCGSGTTLVAAAKLGKHGIGIERDEKHFATACRRVEDAMRQPDLFVQTPERQPVQEVLL